MGALIRVMKDPKADPAKLDAAYNVMQRIQKDSAVRAFNLAMANAKGEIGPVIKNKQVDYEFSGKRTRYAYEDFAAVANTVDPAFAKFGLAYRFRVSQDAGVVRVTCIISHADGHSEENPMQSPPDTSGSKNAVQALGSVVTYLQRYALKAAIGLAATTDDDGRGGPDQPQTSGKPDKKSTIIGPDELMHLEETIEAVTTAKGVDPAVIIGEVEAWAKRPLRELTIDQYERCLVGLNKRLPKEDVQ
jgi:hypothetical protein